MAATNQPDLLPSGAGLAASVAVETHGELGELEEIKARGYWEQVWLRFRRDQVAIAGGIFIVVLPLPARALAAVRRRDPPGGRESGGDGLVDRAMVNAAARRFVKLLAAVAGGTALCSLLLGQLLGASASRSVAVGLYLVGSALLLGGFFVGNRGVFRVANEEGMVGLRVPRGVRVASGDEQEESFNMTGLLVVGGVLLLALGAAVDSSARLL